MNQAPTGCVICRGDGDQNLVGVIICRRGAIFVWDTLELPPDASFYSPRNTERREQVADGGRFVLAKAWRPWLRENFPEQYAERVALILKIANNHKDFLIDP